MKSQAVVLIAGCILLLAGVLAVALLTRGGGRTEVTVPYGTKLAEQPAGEETGSGAAPAGRTGETIGGTEKSERETAEALPAQIPGMPAGYTLSEEEAERKRAMAGRGVSVTPDEAGESYVENEVVCMTEDRAHAEEIAKAYGGTLKEFSYGVATIELNPAVLTVSEALELAADVSNNLPPVEPNYIQKLF